MSSTIITYRCSCGNWIETTGGDECICGKRVYGEGDLFSEFSPEYKAIEELSLNLNKVIPFLKANGNIEDFE